MNVPKSFDTQGIGFCFFFLFQTKIIGITVDGMFIDYKRYKKGDLLYQNEYFPIIREKKSLTWNLDIINGEKILSGIYDYKN